MISPRRRALIAQIGGFVSLLMLCAAAFANAKAQRQPVPGPRLFFGWPAADLIFVGFCGDPNVINIAVAPGASVHAAEAGRVVYAGSELKGFPHLILIRHSDGWVSAYANNDESLVGRGDLVARGQVIAHIGSGDAPRLQFELRHHGASVNPIPYLRETNADTAQMKRSPCSG
jgi:murein DD-endopeptidase MepM/ murein hydrolase activator NlpD